jgi:RNA recognition motif-containing protein
MNIFVSNINFRTQEESLYNLFANFGEVASAKIITDRETGRSRGFGFVEMNDAEGQAAIDKLNGEEFEGKILNVSVARPKEDHRDRGSYSPRRGGFGGNRY